MNAVEPRREYLLRCTNPEPHRPHVTGVATNATWRCPGVKASVFTDEEQRVWEESVERWGMDHTHDISCRTWNPHTNWAGACDCTLPRRAADREAR